MRPGNPLIKEIPLDMVGSSVFGRFSYMSSEETFNMMISDDYLVPLPGYELISNLSNSEKGRGNYSSSRFNGSIFVIGDGVYTSKNGFISLVNTIDTSTGDVFIIENNGGQIAISDLKNIYIFDYINNTFQTAVIDFLPGQLMFQNGYFISPAIGTPAWRLSALNNGLSWPNSPPNVGGFQTKANTVLATLAVPGKGNLLFVFGDIVTEAWINQVSASQFPYQKNTFFNIDYGIANPATLDATDEVVAWIGSNSKSGIDLLVSNGGRPQAVATDGIKYRLDQLKNPTDCYGFIYKQDGHNFYQFTFPSDNLSFLYDFNANKFYTVTDEKMNYHIGRNASQIGGTYYFVSDKDGGFYNFDSKFYTYNSKEIPRVRVTAGFKLPDNSQFIVNSRTFHIEQGTSPTPMRVDISQSKDGGINYGNFVSKTLNTLGNRQNRFLYMGGGICNQISSQFRFFGRNRFVVGNGTMGIYQ